MKIWVGGRVCDPGDAWVSALDHGFTVGDGIFETCKVLGGVPFALTRHLDRLAISAKGLGLPEPDRGLVRRAIDEILAAEPTAGRLRITYTGGVGPLGSDRIGSPPTLVVAVGPENDWPETTAVSVVPWPRSERGALVGLKTTSYGENVVALEYAHERDASEAVFGNLAGRLCEGTGSNVFVVQGGRVLTPPLASGCLAGVTRALVLEWCGAEEADLPLEALQDADEVFLTSSTRDVQAVDRVDDRKLDAPGPVTRRVALEFARRAVEQIDP